MIGLRTLKMAAGGPDADAERQRMVSEKIAAGLAWQALALTGGLGLTPQGAAAKTLTHYRRRVRANRRRLSKGEGFRSDLPKEAFVSQFPHPTFT